MRIPPVQIGLSEIGLDTYWPKFAYLKSRIEGCLATVDPKLARSSVEIINPGLIDPPEKAREVGHAFRRADVDMNLLHVTTYTLSSSLLSVLRRAKLPAVVLNLWLKMAIDYESFNTNNRYHFPMGARAFVNHWNANGPAQHCAIGFGHIARKLTRIAALLGIHIEKIC
jgi:L-arabinose isomerase